MRYIIVFCTILLFSLATIAQEATIAEIVAERPELSQLFEMLELAEPSLLEILNDPDSELTLFAPTNAAFEQLAERLSDESSFERDYLAADSFDAILENSDLLNEILRTHIADEIIEWDSLLANLLENQRVDYLAVNGYPLIISATVYNTGGIVFEEGIRLYSEVNIDQNNIDIEASNGKIYLLDAVLLPEQWTIMDYLNYNASFGEDGGMIHLVDLINAADPAILEMLSDPDTESSLFAPTDPAMEDYEEFESILADSEAATAFLSRHILPEAIYSFQIEDFLAENPELERETLSGDLLTFALVEDSCCDEFYVNDSFVGLPDLPMRNGVIHEIDSVILPSD
jgi:uncharacterized surface protein with fasciclin (FAS1) repeats